MNWGRLMDTACAGAMGGLFFAAVFSQALDGWIQDALKIVLAGCVKAALR